MDTMVTIPFTSGDAVSESAIVFGRGSVGKRQRNVRTDCSYFHLQNTILCCTRNRQEGVTGCSLFEADPMSIEERTTDDPLYSCIYPNV